VAGANDTVLTSVDGVNWTSRNVGVVANQTFYGSGFLNGRFDIVGSSGTILESDPVSPLFDIEIHAAPQQDILTVFATPGSSLQIQFCPAFGDPWGTAATFRNVSGITLWTNNVVGLPQFYFRAVSP
jgi:hypothetical protein